jgi:hypothetical protein
MKKSKNISFSLQTTSHCKQFPGRMILISITGLEELAEQSRGVQIGLARRRRRAARCDLRRP